MNTENLYFNLFKLIKYIIITITITITILNFKFSVRQTHSVRLPLHAACLYDQGYLKTLTLTLKIYSVHYFNSLAILGLAFLNIVF